ncbi:MAG: UDP-N-acetylmuramate--L-alanine ligase [Elusimicrobiota bacterium]
MFEKIKRIHFVGIGGAGMSGIAEVLLNLGYIVTGSDIKDSTVVQRLKKCGAKVLIGHKGSNIGAAQVVVVSTAIDRSNPEVLAAERLKVPVIPRIEMLAEIARLKYAVTIAGTHGKTTTTSMIGMVLSAAGLDPTLVVGGRVRGIDTGAKLGHGEYIVAEADESDGSFLRLNPTIAIVTNIDDDHLDYYHTFTRLKSSFVEYLNNVPFYGCDIICTDNAVVRSVIPKLHRKVYTYGLESQKYSVDFTAEDIRYTTRGAEYVAVYKNKKIGRVSLNLMGAHNVTNSLAAVATGTVLDVKFKKIQSALEDFRGTERRMQFMGERKGVTFIDDYGHHPTEVRATVSALSQSMKKGKRLFVIFQPHRYSRTQLLAEKFGPAFKQAGFVVLTDIYAAGEKPIKGITSDIIYKSLQKAKVDTLYVPLERVVIEVVKLVREGDVVLTLGAGDIFKYNHLIQAAL